MAIGKSISDAIIRRFDKADQRINGPRRAKRKKEFEKFMDDLINPKARIKGTRFRRKKFV